MGGFTRTDFVTDLGGGSAVHLRFGPWNGARALYYTTYRDGGQVRRISHTAPPVIAGSTWYSNGTRVAAGPAGTVVRAYAVGAIQHVPYRLVLGTAGCAGIVAVLIPTVVFASSNGIIGRVQGTIPSGIAPGAYTVCFRNESPPLTATGVATFDLT